MKFKISKYIEWSTIDNELNQQLILSTRTGKKMLIHKDLLSHLRESNINSIPDELFIKLVKNEIIVDYFENEKNIILNRNLCFQDKALSINEEDLLSVKKKDLIKINKFNLAIFLRKKSNLKELKKRIVNQNKRIVIFSENIHLINNDFFRGTNTTVFFFIKSILELKNVKYKEELHNNAYFIINNEFTPAPLFNILYSNFVLRKEKIVKEKKSFKSYGQWNMKPSINYSNVSGLFKDIGFNWYITNFKDNHKKSVEFNFNSRCMSCNLLPVCGGVLGDEINEEFNCPTYKKNLIKILNNYFKVSETRKRTYE